MQFSHFNNLQGSYAKRGSLGAGADLGGGPWGPAPLTPHFEAQIFAAAATPLHNVGKISAAPPPYTNLGSAPDGGEYDYHGC